MEIDIFFLLFYIFITRKIHIDDSMYSLADQTTPFCFHVIYLCSPMQVLSSGHVGLPCFELQLDHIPFAAKVFAHLSIHP